MILLVQHLNDACWIEDIRFFYLRYPIFQWVAIYNWNLNKYVKYRDLPRVCR